MTYDCRGHWACMTEKAICLNFVKRSHGVQNPLEITHAH